jgi:hypothetical protein
VDDFDIMSNNNTTTQPSIGDVLHRDLIECLRYDKKLFWQGAVPGKAWFGSCQDKACCDIWDEEGIEIPKWTGRFCYCC